RRLVELLVSFGLHIHRLGLRFALLEDDFSFRFALRANGGGASLGFHHQALTFGFGDRFDAFALILRLLEDARHQLALAALDFGFLLLDLMLLVNLADGDFLGLYLLLHHVGLNVIRLVGLGLLALHHFEIFGLLDFEVALGLRLFGLR